MSRRILIDTFNSGLAKPTGIGTYARVLTHANHSLGHEVILLTDAQIIRSGNASRQATAPPDSVLLFDHPSNRHHQQQQAGNFPWYVRNRIYSLRRLARRRSIRPWAAILGSTAPAIRQVQQLDLVEQAPIRRQLGHFDGIVNGYDLFHTALERFHRTRQVTEIDLPSDVDIAHFTWCLPIRVRNAKHNIYTLHDLIPLRFPYLTLDRKDSYYDLVAWCARTADRIVTVSETSRREIVQLLRVPSEKVVNTFQALEPTSDRTSRPQTDDVKSAVQALFGLTYNKYFVMAGAIEPRKNTARAIEAHLTADTDFPLVICGPQNALSKGELAFLESLKSNDRRGSVPNKIIMPGYVSRDLLTMLIAGARALVAPSITEGFGLPALEAMSLGTPVIASTAGALLEVCGAAAIYVEPYDTAALRHAIDRVAGMSKPEFAELKSKSTAQAAGFSFETYCSRLRDAYSSL
jgi:glycosyltransferase involved in cell wall biosynthesis